MVKEINGLFTIYAKNKKSAWHQARHDRTIAPWYVVKKIKLLGPAKRAKGKKVWWAEGYRR